jgi:hypothetical protein
MKAVLAKEGFFKAPVIRKILTSVQQNTPNEVTMEEVRVPPPPTQCGAALNAPHLTLPARADRNHHVRSSDR